MFPLSDPTRRRLCAILFALLGVMPLAVVAAWCAAWHLPGRAEAVAEELGRQLGLKVSLGGLQYVRPGVVRYEKLRLTQPETGQTILHCALLEADQTGGSEQAAQPQLLFRATQLEIAAEGLEELLALLQHVMQSRTGPAEPHIGLSACKATIRSSSGGHDLTELQGLVEAVPGGVQARFSFRVAEANMPQPAQVRIWRNRQTVPPTSGFEISSGQDSWLPSRLLAAAVPDLARLGTRCRIQGYLGANQMPDGWQGKFMGQVADVDLEPLAAAWSSHKLSGTGQVTIQEAQFRGGRLEQLRGFLEAGPGLVGRSLIAAGIERLSLSRGNVSLGLNETLPYEQLALALILDGQGLRLQGCCKSAEPGSIIADRYGRLLGDPTVQPQPAAALVQMLLSPTAASTDVSYHADRLNRLLPLPGRF